MKMGEEKFICEGCYHDLERRHCGAGQLLTWLLDMSLVEGAIIKTKDDGPMWVTLRFLEIKGFVVTHETPDSFLIKLLNPYGNEKKYCGGLCKQE